ncbi:MAG: DNA (cytosine-5-)-methyltransferase [Desulfobacteraceae bacterium]|nr:DNA (cytosine-5-)-methyltransferase [Desulfobacteraceae bacterium]
MRHLDLFSGIGGFALAASWVWGSEHEIVAFCEIDKYCRSVLGKHWPGAPIIEDIRDVTAKALSDLAVLQWKAIERSEPDGNLPVDEIDLLTGGFPCQPFSCAGKRAGKADDRFLWPEMLRVIKKTRPRFILAENVPGIIRMELDNCLSALEAEGYACGTLVIPACAVNAPHRRDRVWIVAHRFSNGQRGILRQAGCGQNGPQLGEDSHREGSGNGGDGTSCENASNPECSGLEGRHQERSRPETALSFDEVLANSECGGRRERSKPPGRQKGTEADGLRSQRVSDVAHTEIKTFGAGLCESEPRGEWRGRSCDSGCQGDDPDSEVFMPGHGFVHDVQKIGYGKKKGSVRGTVQPGNWWTTEPCVGRVAHGIPSRVDRLRALGNAIVPQVAVEIMRAIREADETI